VLTYGSYLGDFFIPSFSCPFPVTRVGTMGDGGKWVCGYERVVHQKDCVIYSSGTLFVIFTYGALVLISRAHLGVAQESSFEKAILERSKTCQIYGYDFSVDNVSIFARRLRSKPTNGVNSGDLKFVKFPSSRAASTSSHGNCNQKTTLLPAHRNTRSKAS
jgi:hypothetical protein